MTGEGIMNRADRRRFAKEGIKGEVKETLSLNSFIHLYTLSFMLALDSCEIEKEKVVEIMEKVYENAECMTSGHINQRDVETMCRDVYGIDFTDGVKNNIYVVNGKLVKV